MDLFLPFLVVYQQYCSRSNMEHIKGDCRSLEVRVKDMELWSCLLSRCWKEESLGRSGLHLTVICVADRSLAAVTRGMRATEQEQNESNEEEQECFC